MNSKDPIVIVGAGLAGATAAQTLRAEGYAGALVVLGDEPTAPYWRPPLSKGLLAGYAQPEHIAVAPPRTWADQDIDLRTGIGALELDPTARTLALTDGSRLRYDQLLLATGGRPRRLTGMDGARTLRTLSDALALRDELSKKPSLLVVGAGVLGLEVAATARSLGCDVAVLELAGAPLARVAPPWLGGLFAALHRRNGVRLALGVPLDRVIETDDGVVAVAQDGRTNWSADLAVAALGMVPETGLAERAGLVVDGGIVVDEWCRTSAPRVFAAGDVTAQTHPLLGGRHRIEHYANAMDQATAAARNMLGNKTSYAPVPAVSSEQFGTRLELCGWPDAADVYGDRGWSVRGEPEDLNFSALFWRDDRLVAAACVGRSGEFEQLHRIIRDHPYTDVDRLTDPDIDLATIVG
ncbi:NADPH-dependent 2,4-dienoyl-CoA reductase/sulfur reductase-like enzyme [Nocardia tenerifensis]|uniref:NADPH-dependent 2,4-dienoyl-CoA reductase/sulfur reductase-like enzyme n=1 Tax=Nocardia tenerifensis TaxID=228006 RepID=A0A318KJH9_9NOCA|nr:FAD-dependent oxidoreductase [Nocardia tenerifensis]PXX61117.1 NADPH-dependent 2,4-dienoyl-CoA reductase/sulfur reductase-like enzyme [Nocardia tenerifensis]